MKESAVVFRRLTLQPSKLRYGWLILDRGERARAHCGERDGAPSDATAPPILRRPSAPLRALLRSHLLLPQARGAESFHCDGDNIAKVIAMRDPTAEVDVQSALGLSRGIYADAPGVMLQNNGEQLQSDPLPCATRGGSAEGGGAGRPTPFLGLLPTRPLPMPPPARPSPRRPSPPQRVTKSPTCSAPRWA